MTTSFKAPKHWIALLAATVLLPLAAVRAFDDPPKNGKFARLYWMAGAWRCDDKVEPVEEHWSEAARGVMIGMCRMGANPERALYEIILIEDRSEGPVMSIRHFGNGLRDRDAKIAAFKLTHADDKEAVFEDPANDFPSKITYRVTGQDQRLIRLEGKRRDKPISKDFPMQRIRS